jgi:hypothetical protein
MGVQAQRIFHQYFMIVQRLADLACLATLDLLRPVRLSTSKYRRSMHRSSTAHYDTTKTFAPLAPHKNMNVIILL